jgi:hypothetical protein
MCYQKLALPHCNLPGASTKKVQTLYFAAFAATRLVQTANRIIRPASMPITLQNLLAAKLLEGSWAEFQFTLPNME